MLVVAQRTQRRAHKATSLLCLPENKKSNDQKMVIQQKKIGKAVMADYTVIKGLSIFYRITNFLQFIFYNLFSYKTIFFTIHFLQYNFLMIFFYFTF